MEEKEKTNPQKQEKDQSRKKKSEEEIRKIFKKVTSEDSDNEEIEEKYVDDEFKCNINQKEATIKRKRNIETDIKIAKTAPAHLNNEVRAADQIISNKNKTKVISARKMDRMRKRAQLQKKNKSKGFKVRGLMLEDRINEN